eukprot:gene22276-25242_t
MDWQKLDLAKASVLKREVDVALQRVYDTNPDVNKSKLYSAIQYRIQELENFCAKNSQDERIILFEKERLRLRKAHQSQTSSRQDARSVGTTGNRSTSPAAISTTSGNKLNSASKLPVPQATPGSAQASVYSTRTMGSQRNSVTPLNRSISGIQSTNANTTTGPLSQPQQIYAWEDGNERAERVPLDVGGV